MFAACTFNTYIHMLYLCKIYYIIVKRWNNLICHMFLYVQLCFDVYIAVIMFFN